MELRQNRDAEHMATRIEFIIYDYELADVIFDPMDRLVINSPRSKETPIADALQTMQIWAYRYEQQHPTP